MPPEVIKRKGRWRRCYATYTYQVVANTKEGKVLASCSSRKEALIFLKHYQKEPWRDDLYLRKITNIRFTFVEE